MTLIEYSEYSGTFEWFLSGWQNKYAENVQLCPLLLYHTYHCLCKWYFRDRKHVRITSILCAIYDCLVAISHQQSGDRHKLWNYLRRKCSYRLFVSKLEKKEKDRNWIIFHWGKAQNFLGFGLRCFAVIWQVICGFQISWYCLHISV